MTISSSTTAVEREGNGSAREFSFSPIVVFDETQLEVVLRDTDGSLTTLTRGTGSSAYSVQATFTENEAATGSIRYPDSGGTLLTAGQFLSIRRVVPFTQDTSFENQGGYLPEVQEQTHDLHTMRALQLSEEVARSVKAPFGSGIDSDDYFQDILDASASAAASAATATTKAGEAAASAAAANASEINADADAAATAADRIQTGLDAAATAADRIQTGLDAAATAADRIQTGLDAAATAADALDTAADALAAAESAAKLKGTSTTSVVIGTGSKSFTTQTGKFFDVGTFLLVTSDANAANYMHGRVTGYSGTSLTLDVTSIGGTGTFADWTIRVSGARGADGLSGSTAWGAITGTLSAQADLQTALDAKVNASAANLTGSFRVTGIISPTVSANQNNWNPTGLATANVILADITGTFDITGITAGADGQLLYIFNTHASGVGILRNDNASSTAANRITTPNTNGFTIRARSGALLMYDGTAQRWRLLDSQPDLQRAIGTLPIVNGGTGLTSVGTSGHVLTSNGSAFVMAAPAGGGKVVKTQFYSSGAFLSVSGSIPNDNTIPQKTEGGQVRQETYTPLNASNIIEVHVSGSGAQGASDGSGSIMTLFDSGVHANDAVKTQYSTCNTAGQHIHTFDIIYHVTAGSTSARTFEVRAGGASSGTAVQFGGNNGGQRFGGSCHFQISIREYAPN